MSDNNNHIDNLFKEKMSERSFDVPASFLTDLENKLDAAPVASKKIRGFWFWMSSILVAGLATAGYFLLEEPTEIPELYSVIKTIDSDSAKSSDDNSEALFVKVKNADEKETFVAASTYRKAPKAFKPENQKALASLKEDIQANYKRVEDSIRLANEKAMMASAEGNPEFNTASNDQNGRTLDSIEKDLLASLGANNLVRKLLTEDPNFGAFNGQRQQFLTQATNLAYVDDTLKKVRYIIRDSVVIRDSLVVRDSIRYIDFTLADGTKGVELKDDKKQSGFELKAFGGFLNAKSQIESPFADYSEELASGESVLLSPNFGFNLFWFKKNFNIGTGLEYYNYGEKYDYTTLETSTVFSQMDTVLTSVIIDSMGQPWTINSQLPPFDTITVVSLDSTFITDSTSTAYSGQNIYSRIIVPLTFGYQFNINKWALTPHVGLNFEFTTAYRPGLYTNALNEEILELDQRKFGMSYRLQLEIRRNFDKFHIFVNPYYQNNIGFTIDTPDLKRKYGGLGAQFGFGVRL